MMAIAIFFAELTFSLGAKCLVHLTPSSPVVL